MPVHSLYICDGCERKIEKQNGAYNIPEGWRSFTLTENPANYSSGVTSPCFFLICSAGCLRAAIEKMILK